MIYDGYFCQLAKKASLSVLRSMPSDSESIICGVDVCRLPVDIGGCTISCIQRSTLWQKMSHFVHLYYRSFLLKFNGVVPNRCCFILYPVGLRAVVEGPWVKVSRNGVQGLGNLRPKRSGCKIIGFHKPESPFLAQQVSSLRCANESLKFHILRS